MRIFRPAATKPIPEGAQIDRQKGIVSYRVKGKTRRAALTSDGTRMRIETATWHLEFRDHLGRKQSFPAFSHEGQTRFLASAIERLIAFHGQPLPADLKDYCDKLVSRIATVLRACGLLSIDQTDVLVERMNQVLALQGQLAPIELKAFFAEDLGRIATSLQAVKVLRAGEAQPFSDKVEQLAGLRGQRVPDALRDYLETLPGQVIGVLQSCGLVTTEQMPTLKPLSELLAMYEQTLRARERSAKHVYESVTLPKEVFEACGFGLWREIRDDKVQDYLKDLREGHVLRKAAKGKDAKPRRVGYRRSNAYLIACQAFGNWIVDDREWAEKSPLGKLTKLEIKADRRHKRRGLSIEELRTLLQKTAEGPERYGMTGRERYLLYRFVIETGLRAGEIRRLRRSDFDFEGRTVLVRGQKASKNKEDREQALTEGLCAELRDFMGNKLPGVKAFGGTWAELTDKTADMLREDLAAAGIVYSNDRAEIFDFHGLRAECASLLIENGVDPKLAQEIMRHSSIGLTMDVYAKVLGGRKKAQAVASLPDLSLPESQRQVLAKTGTDDRDVTPESLRKVYSQDGRDRTRPDSIGQVTGDSASKTAFLTQNQGVARTVDPKVEGSRPFGLAS